jgi:hypothetical protein
MHNAQCSKLWGGVSLFEPVALVGHWALSIGH